MTPKTPARKAKMDKRDYIKLRSFCIAKETAVKGQPMDCEKIFSN
jgi:hypothetical protein